MKIPHSNELLWMISFDHSREYNTLKERAYFHIPFPMRIPEGSEAQRLLALDFLQQMNTSFKDLTEVYLSEAEKDEANKPQAEQIREKFKSLDAWIKWLRHWNEENEEDKPE